MAFPWHLNCNKTCLDVCMPVLCLCKLQPSMSRHGGQVIGLSVPFCAALGWNHARLPPEPSPALPRLPSSSGRHGSHASFWGELPTCRAGLVLSTGAPGGRGMLATWEALRWYPRKELVGDIAGEWLALALCHDVPGASGSLSIHTCKMGMTTTAASQSCW